MAEATGRRATPTIRLARRDDLPRLVAIYNEAIAMRNATGDLAPFDVAAREAWFDAHDPARAPIHVAELDGRVVGYNSLTPYREGRPAFVHVMETSYFIAAEARRHGIATALLETTVALCAGRGVASLVCFLLAHNAPSRAFLEHHGFALWGTLPGAARIDGGEYDHLVYGRRLD